MSNSVFGHESAIFQLSPLRESFKYTPSMDAMKSCRSAIEIIERIYHKSETVIRNREFFLLSVIELICDQSRRKKMFLCCMMDLGHHL